MDLGKRAGAQLVQLSINCSSADFCGICRSSTSTMLRRTRHSPGMLTMALAPINDGQRRIKKVHVIVRGIGVGCYLRKQLGVDERICVGSRQNFCAPVLPRAMRAPPDPRRVPVDQPMDKLVASGTAGKMVYICAPSWFGERQERPPTPRGVTVQRRR